MVRGGCSDIADELTKRIGKKVSRQQIHTWWTRRERNGFPEGSPLVKVNPSGKTQKFRCFNVDEVLDWYTSYVPDKGGRPKKDLDIDVYDEVICG